MVFCGFSFCVFFFFIKCGNLNKISGVFHSLPNELKSTHLNVVLLGEWVSRRPWCGYVLVLSKVVNSANYFFFNNARGGRNGLAKQIVRHDQ